MIYVILYSMRVRSLTISGLFYSASINKVEAEKLYSQMILTEEYYKKSLWSIDSNGVRMKLDETLYS